MDPMSKKPGHAPYQRVRDGYRGLLFNDRLLDGIVQAGLYALFGYVACHREAPAVARKEVSREGSEVGMSPRNKATRIITATDLPADPKPPESLVAIERSKAEAMLAVLEWCKRCHETANMELMTQALQAIRGALERPELAMFQPWEFDDLITGNRVRIEVSPQYSELQINNRHYYFHRETGKWDGTGTDFEPMD